MFDPILCIIHSPGLFPIAYYQRALLHGDVSGRDMAMANLTANHYILQYVIGA